MRTACAGAAGHGQRHHAESEGQRGHDDRTQAHAASLHRRLEQTHAVAVQILGELDNQNGVLRRQTDGGQQADLEEHVVGQATAGGRQYGADDAQRHHQHHREGNRPALVQRRQAEEHHQQRERVERRRLAAGEELLEGKPGPRHADPRRQLLRQALDLGHGVAGAVAGRRLAENLHPRHAVVTRELRRAIDPFTAAEGAERHHFALSVAHEPLVQVLGRHARGRVALHVHLLHPATVDEVVDVAGAPADRQRVVDLAQRNTQRTGLLVVDQQLVLRFVVQPVGSHGLQQRTLRRQPEELVTCLHQGFMAEARLVLQVEVEAGGVAQLHDRRWREGEHLRVAELEEALLRTLRQIEDAGAGRGTLVPWLEPDEGHGRVLSTPGEVEASHGEHRIDHVAFLVQQVLAHGVHGLLGPLGGGTSRRLYLGEQHTLVLVRQESAGQAGEQQRHGRDDHQVDQQERQLALEHPGHTPLVAMHAAVEGAVEPAEETALLLMLAIAGLEHGGAQRRGKDQRHQYRQPHRRGDGDGELAIDDTGRTAEERHRHEHRREHQADAHQRTLDLPHGLACGLHRRQPFLGHHPLDVLHHHDGVVHQ